MIAFAALLTGRLRLLRWKNKVTLTLRQWIRDLLHSFDFGIKYGNADKRLCFHSPFWDIGPSPTCRPVEKIQWNPLQNLNPIHPNGLTEHLNGLSSHCDLWQLTESSGWKFL